MKLLSLFKRKPVVQGFTAPEGFSRITDLQVTTKDSVNDYELLDWRLVPDAREQHGSIFAWLKIDGVRTPFWFSNVESEHFPKDPSYVSRYTAVRVLADPTGRLLLVPNVETKRTVSTLPPPPKKFNVPSFVVL